MTDLIRIDAEVSFRSITLRGEILHVSESNQLLMSMDKRKRPRAVDQSAESDGEQHLC